MSLFRPSSLALWLAIALAVGGCAKVKLIEDQSKRSTRNPSTIAERALVQPLIGTAVLSGGGRSVAPGIQLEGTIGESTTEIVQGSSAVRVHVGLQATIN